jgi:GNAT superfamily N-acetyltransferase
VIVGGGRYIIVRPGTGVLAFAVGDNYQGQGIGAALLRHLSTIAREAGIGELIAEVLPDNISCAIGGMACARCALFIQVEQHAAPDPSPTARPHR